MSPELCLQVGGTLNPRQHLYVERPEDERFFRLLLEGQYVNVLTSRQMGKSSLMMRTVHRLDQEGVRWVTIDLASELGSPPDLNAYYLGLLGKIARSLRLELDLKAWWVERDTETVNQRLLRFFREVVAGRISEPLVVFLDEIDSTLKLPYTDDLFTAIRGMYNERAIVDAYRRITFCLLGVATPNELIKSRRTTAYNVGTTFELRDFDNTVDDLSPLAAALNSNPEISKRLLDRVLYWSGGQPYLTQKFCADIVDKHIGDADGVDELVTRSFNNLDQASNDIHFQQILRFLEERLSDEAATIELYAKILRDGRVPDQTTLAHAELKLSGLVKRDRDGKLVVRNPIYQRLFDTGWVENTRPRRALGRTRRYAIAASVALTVVLGGGATYYTTIVLPEQRRLATLDRLAQLKISIIRAKEGDGSRASLPTDITQARLTEAIPLLKAVGPITEIDVSSERPVSLPQDRSPTGAIDDLSPFAELKDLRSIDLLAPGRQLRLNFTSLEPLKQLTNLRSLNLYGAADITSLEPLRGLRSLMSLELSDSPDIANLEPLKGLTSLSSLNLYGYTGISSLETLKGLTNLSSLTLSRVRATSLEPLKSLTKLKSLDLWFAINITSLEPLTSLTNLSSLDLTGATGITSLEPLNGLTNLSSLDLTGATGITSLEPLKGLTNLSSLELQRATGITSLEPLKGLTELTSLNLTGATGITSLEPLKGLTNLSSLELQRATGITSLEPLKGLTNLSSLDLTDATGITSLAPLKGKRIDIRGASRELLATME
jgi:hypothetical protein